MPNRIIRDGLIESEAVNQLDAHAERFFFRLLLRADDYARYHANPLLLKSNLFPLRDDVRSADITRWLAACEKAGLVRCYSASDKPYLEIPKFGQRARADQSKFPEPPAEPSTALLPGMALSETTGKRTAHARHLPDKRPTTAGPPRTYAESKTKKQASAASRPTQESDPFGYALARACALAPEEMTPRACTQLALALNEILAASPGATPEEIASRARAYRRKMPAGCRITPHALAKHWAGLGAGAGDSPASEAPPEPEGWRDILEQLFPGNAINQQGHGWSTVLPEIQAKVLQHGRAA